MTDKYYLIKQSVPYLDVKIIKIFTPCNISHINKLISFMFGKIEVFLVDTKDNSRIDLTAEMGVLSFDIYHYDFHKMFVAKMIYKNPSLINKYFTFYSIFDFRHDEYIPKFFMNNHVFKCDGIEMMYSYFFLCDIEKHNQKNKFGNDYEEFVSLKYKQSGYEVILNGKESFNDGGIDIIAKKDNHTILVQCKNWSMSNSYKINQKDLRAFIGDCYLYMLNNPISNKVSFHFIVSHDNILTKSAEIFLKNNKILKFKCVPFEI